MRWARKAAGLAALLSLLLAAAFILPAFVLPRSSSTYIRQTMLHCVSCSDTEPWVARTTDDFLIRTADPQTDLFISRDLHFWGYWEKHTVAVWRQLLTEQPGTVVVDVGASMGSFSLLSARLGARKVVAVEMQRRMVTYLLTSLLLNDAGQPESNWASKRVQVHNIALVEAVENLKQEQICFTSPGSHNLGGASIRVQCEGAKCECVRANTLGRLLAAEGVAVAADSVVHILKIDAEGFD